MDTCAFSEGLARLYADFADSIRDNNSESVRSAYKQLRNSGRPISEILNEAIHTIGVSYDELEKHLLGDDGSNAVEDGHVVGHSVLVELASPEPYVNVQVQEPDITLFVPGSPEHSVQQLTPGATRESGLFRMFVDTIFGGFYVRLATWALVVGIVGFVSLSVVQMLPFSWSGNRKLADGEIVSPRRLSVAVAADQKELAPRVPSPGPSNSITAGPLALGSHPQNGGAVTNPRSSAKSHEETSSGRSAIPVKAEGIGEDVNKPEASPKPITTAAAEPQGLISSGDVARRSAGVENQIRPVEPPQPAAAEVISNAGPGRALNESGMAAKPHAILPARAPAVDTSLLVERGDSLFRIGDIASARGFYERAAEQGNGQAALRLGESYDPSFLQQAHLPLVRADISVAVLWYRRARDLGVTEARILLKDGKE